MKLSKLMIQKSTILLGGSFLCLNQYISAQDQAVPPNILIIMTDQQAFSALGYSGNQVIKTPNLDKLAGQGVYFSQAATPCPVCVPARTSILTGRLIETTKVRENRDIEKNDCYYYPTYDEILIKAGYISEYYGKFHSPEFMARVFTNPPIKGLTGNGSIVRWESKYINYLKESIKKRQLKPGELYETTFYKGIVPYKLDPIDRRYNYLPSGEIPENELKLKKLGQDDVHGVLDLPAKFTITAVQASEAIEALERIKNRRFILTCSFLSPHVPITPSEPFASMYKHSDIHTPESIHDNRINSPYQPNPLESSYTDPDKVKFMAANYYAFVTEIDDWVGKILGKLDDLKLADNTLVVFVSDHGEMLGAHGMRGKFCFYEESIRVPLIMRYPGMIKAGLQISAPVSTLNIFPTLLDYVGLKNIPSDGYSLKPVIEGAAPKYDFSVSEWTWKNPNVPSLMIRTKNWKLLTTHRSGGKDVEALYDLKNDPNEMNNLLGSNPERFKYRGTVDELRTKLIGYLKDVNSPLTEGVESRVLIRE